MSLPLCSQCDTVLRASFRFCPKCGRPCSEPQSEATNRRRKNPEPQSEATNRRRKNPEVPGGVNPDRVGIYMDTLTGIIDDLNASETLQQIFGVPVSRGLVVVADNNDLRIEDGGRAKLTEEQQKVFLSVLDQVIRANSV